MGFTYSTPRFEIRKDRRRVNMFVDEIYFTRNFCDAYKFYGITEIITWCYENINGQFQLADSPRGPLLIIFTDEDAAMAFKLRWE